VVINKGSVEKSKLSEVEAVQLKKNSFERVLIENLVEFWRRQSKVIEKKWQERQYTVQKRLHV
jgi:predicted nucleic acid-binding protein